MSDYCQLCNTANGAHTHYCPANPANERSELASATGYAAGDRVEITSPAAYRGLKATVHWFNGKWMNVRLDNGIILPMECKEVKPHNDQAHAPVNNPK